MSLVTTSCGVAIRWRGLTLLFVAAALPALVDAGLVVTMTEGRLWAAGRVGTTMFALCLWSQFIVSLAVVGALLLRRAAVTRITGIACAAGLVGAAAYTITVLLYGLVTGWPRAMDVTIGLALRFGSDALFHYGVLAAACLTVAGHYNASTGVLQVRLFRTYVLMWIICFGTRGAIEGYWLLLSVSKSQIGFDNSEFLRVLLPATLWSVIWVLVWCDSHVHGVKKMHFYSVGLAAGVHALSLGGAIACWGTREEALSYVIWGRVLYELQPLCVWCAFALMWRRGLFARGRLVVLSPGRCPQCGYSLIGHSSLEARCPECGGGASLELVRVQ